MKDIFESRKNKQIAKALKMLEKYYKKAYIEILDYAKKLDLDIEKEDALNDERLQKKIDEVVKKIEKQNKAIYSAIIASCVGMAAFKKLQLAEFFRKDLHMSESETKVVFGRTMQASEYFAKRVDEGFDISARVWDLSQGIKTDMLYLIIDHLQRGNASNSSATLVKQFLKEPNRLFRRVRDKITGKLHLSSNALKYHSGQGVYRSSYMNARRLMVTETNMAYRSADCDNNRDNKWVVGIEIKLSGNHNSKGIPRGKFHDICDEAQGKYPRGWKFVGWHPHCRCYMLTILKTPKEMKEDLLKIRIGDPVIQNESVNAVHDVPYGFKAYVEEHKAQISGWSNVPYWVRDNFEGGNINNDIKDSVFE